MKIKGLTLTIIFLAESANYGEGIGNVATLKKISRNKGEQYTYISRQALRYSIVELLEMLGETKAIVTKSPGVVQFEKETTINDSAELDFFGYMKTEGGVSTRSAVVRLSNAISLEIYKGDLDFLTNKGLADRINQNNDIAQSEIHRSYYKYTITIDLDKIGIDEIINEKKEEIIELEKEQKSERVKKLLDAISILYRDIKGRREDLKPLFVIGGVYDIKNPFFENLVDVKNENILVDKLVSGIHKIIEKDTKCGIIKEQFQNETELREKLKNKNITVQDISEVFNDLKKEIDKYYEIETNKKEAK
ncbi:type I-B CRISPR-associated protein Cas7/Cst2/DevR [Pseudoleptotrichia goodfellowii]|uniref:CRISPR-associated regulatory protein, DevR family n=1 Tax=Pseudoleptotrichia goodfellowii F0264 TaxID=596323 RepID=D0GJK8_9FUSO|nr:type I-B CRISPR-associated protein Cas7/Cst2/DevR [Pseudoleptotrichia goodfellowii]EEY35722.1 CRISPR-associated regulatory protein, DevR family [Pseudoleptotrichia goodfellowii F0264]